METSAAVGMVSRSCFGDNIRIAVVNRRRYIDSGWNPGSLRQARFSYLSYFTAGALYTSLKGVMPAFGRWLDRIEFLEQLVELFWLQLDSIEPPFPFVTLRAFGNPPGTESGRAPQCRPQAGHRDESSGAHQGQTETRCRRTHGQTRTITRAGQKPLPISAWQICRLKIQTSSGRINTSPLADLFRGEAHSMLVTGLRSLWKRRRSERRSFRMRWLAIMCLESLVRL